MFDLVFDAVEAHALDAPHDVAGPSPAAGKSTVATQALIVVEDEAAERAVSGVLEGNEGGVAVVTASALAADWPDYVAARARTSGAVVVDAARAQLGEAWRSLGGGVMLGRRAEAGVVGGALVFALQGASNGAPEAVSGMELS